MAHRAAEERTALTRRRLLTMSAAGAGAALLAACGDEAVATATTAPRPTTGASMTTTAPAATAPAMAAPTTAAAAGASTMAPAAAAGNAPVNVAATPTGASTTGMTAPPMPATVMGMGKRGGKITWALEQDPVNLIPFGAVSTSNMWGKEFMYDSLLEWDRNLNIRPALAESYETPDANTYIFKLRKGVKFHDGKELDAGDVKYSLETMLNPPPPGIKNLPFTFTSIEAVDKYTAKLTLAKADPSIPGVMAWARYTPIVPAGALQKINPASQGIGTGPYKLVEFVPNDRVVFTRNPDFWKPGLPYFDDITLKVLPDEQSRLAALRSGAIDGGTFTADVAQTAKNDRNLSILTGLFAAPRVAQFTIRGGEKKPWHDVRVRQAINLAVNRADIIDKVYGGEAELTGPIPPGYGDWFIPASELASTFYKQDVAAAKKLMADAGFGGGFPITLQAIAAPRDFTQIAEILREQLKVIGVAVTVQPLEIGTFAKNVGDGTYDWASTGRGMRGDPSGFVNDFNNGTANYSKWFADGWENAELNKAYADALAQTDQAKRKPLYRRIQEIILTEVPHLYTVQNKKYQIVRTRVKNMYVSFTDFNSGLREAWVEG